ncbi:hypothetical protein [Thalassotalea crassostreae]|uniref:hypothetical protein n=1 Tax=Thalassotalea crassostreae TaxID=1763536 RepID=UPI0039F61D83
MNKFVSLIFVMFSCSIQAKDSDIINVDRAINNDIELSFPNDESIKPKKSDFEVLNYVLMSNEIGERFAVITLRNLSSGNRTLEDNQLMALFADGERKVPTLLKLNFEGNEVQSITVSFGNSKFPILSVYSNS